MFIFPSYSVWNGGCCATFKIRFRRVRKKMRMLVFLRISSDRILAERKTFKVSENLTLSQPTKYRARTFPDALSRTYHHVSSHAPLFINKKDSFDEFRDLNSTGLWGWTLTRDDKIFLLLTIKNTRKNYPDFYRLLGRLNIGKTCKMFPSYF